MTPDVFTDLQIVNATRRGLYPGDGGDNKGFCNAYQMEWWFGCKQKNKNYPKPVAAARAGVTYKLQFQNGVGDQDDGADMQLNVTDANTGACNVVYVKARSDNRSVHRIEVEVQAPDLPRHGPFVVAFNRNGEWPDGGPSPLEWYVAGQSFQTGTDGHKQCLAVIDLQLWFPPDFANTLLNHIKARTLGRADAELIWSSASLYLDLD